MEKKLCLITEVPSHYRKLIYSVLEEEMGCEFIVSTQKGSIKRIDKNALSHVVEVNVKYLGDSHWYFLKGAMKPLSQYDVILNDLGIYSLTAWMILIKSKFTGQKVYNWSHGWYGREGFVKKWFKRMYHGLATGSFIYGDYAIRLMKENGFDERKLFQFIILLIMMLT